LPDLEEEERLEGMVGRAASGTAEAMAEAMFVCGSEPAR
jgi:hypothetical protein